MNAQKYVLLLQVSYQGDFLEITLQNLTQIPDMAWHVHQMVICSPI